MGAYQATIESIVGLKTNEQAIKDAIYKQVDAGLKSNMVDKGGIVLVLRAILEP